MFFFSIYKNLLHVAENRITLINSEAFLKTNLTEVYLALNTCVYKKWKDPMSIVNMQKTVNLNCNYISVEPPLLHLELVSCESLTNVDWGRLYLGPSEPKKTCSMEKITSIASLGILIKTNNESALALKFDRNMNIFYLPEKIHRNFPNLRIYSARKCSVKQISKQNFEGLRQLRVLMLGSNFIEKVALNTFQDLWNLEKLFLGKKFTSKIQFTKSLTFQLPTKSNS